MTLFTGPITSSERAAKSARERMELKALLIDAGMPSSMAEAYLVRLQNAAEILAADVFRCATTEQMGGLAELMK